MFAAPPGAARPARATRATRIQLLDRLVQSGDILVRREELRACHRIGTRFAQFAARQAGRDARHGNVLESAVRPSHFRHATKINAPAFQVLRDRNVLGVGILLNKANSALGELRFDVADVLVQQIDGTRVPGDTRIDIRDRVTDVADFDAVDGIARCRQGAVAAHLRAAAKGGCNGSGIAVHHRLHCFHLSDVDRIRIFGAGRDIRDLPLRSRSADGHGAMHGSHLLATVRKRIDSSIDFRLCVYCATIRD
ncbi:hypothetical protein WK58_30120 [Burkholderia ubonensis]|nr:hypothetical protein WK58_30120 [Burkholderia ubonensis]